MPLSVCIPKGFGKSILHKVALHGIIHLGAFAGGSLKNCHL